MSHFELGNGLFFLLMFQPEHILLSKNWHGKQAQH